MPSGVAPGTPDSLGTVGAPMSRDAALEAAPRAMIQSPRVKGSLSLRGGRIDDLSLEDYKVTLEPDSPDVTLLSPLGSEHPFYAVYGWLPTAETPVATPGPNTARDKH